MKEKLHIRLPSDDQHGPNPYDSKTPIEELTPRWLRDWKWWVSIAIISVVFYMVRVWRGLA